MNKAIIMGNLGADPEVRYMPNGDAAVTLRVATNKSWTDKDSGERKQHTEWHTVIAFGKRAEVIGEYFRKGSKILIEGELRTRKWTDKQNIDRWTTEIRMTDFEFVESKGTGRPPHPADDPSNYPPEERSTGRGADSSPSPQTGTPDLEDDIPF